MTGTATEIPKGHGNSRLLTVLAVGNFAIGMGAFVVIGILEPLAKGLQIDRAAASQVLTLYAIAYAISSPILAAATGTLPRRTVLGCGLGLFLIGIVLSAAASSLTLLLMARVLTALGAGLFTPATAAVAVATSEPANRGKALSTVFAGLTLAQVAGVPVGSWIGFTFGWQAAFVVVGVLAAVSLAGVIRLVPSTVPFQPAGLSSLVKTLTDPIAFVAVLVTTTLLGSAYVVFTFLAPIVATKLGLDRDGVTLMLVIYGAGAFVGNLIGGRLGQTIGPFRTLMLIAVTQAILMPLVTLPAYPLPVGAIILFLWAVSTWSFMAPQQMRLVALVPQAQNVILALNASAIYVGAAVGSAIAAAALPVTGLIWLGIVGACVGLVPIAHLLASQWQVKRGTRS